MRKSLYELVEEKKTSWEGIEYLTLENAFKLAFKVRLNTIRECALQVEEPFRTEILNLSKRTLIDSNEVENLLQLR